MQVDAEQGRAGLAPNIAEGAKCNEGPQKAGSTHEEKQGESTENRDDDCREDAKYPQHEDDTYAEGRTQRNKSKKKKHEHDGALQVLST